MQIVLVWASRPTRMMERSGGYTLATPRVHVQVPGLRIAGLPGSASAPGVLCPLGWRYSARCTSAGLSRAVARPGQNATALAMTITAGTMSSTGQIGVRGASGMPRPWANSAQLHRPATTPNGRSASRASPVTVLTCQAVIALTCRREQPEGLQDGEITSPPPSRHHDELPEYRSADNGEQRGQDRGSALDAWRSW